jgi:GNAT superfamily N-acetyltransferase
MEVRLARGKDVDTYAALGREVQAMLQARGLEQYVPAAHDEYAAAIRARVEANTLYAVWDNGTAVGFFSLDAVPSPWWPTDGEPALYVAGMVVSPQAPGRGVGSSILEWCLAEASRRGCRLLRLDCHAGNTWLCRYYESHGFLLCGQVEQYPGYFGCLYQRAVPLPQGSHILNHSG